MSHASTTSGQAIGYLVSLHWPQSFPGNLLWSNLHLSDNTQAPGRSDPSFDRLYKLQPLLRILADAFRAAHEPSQQISVDEAMVRYKGRSSLKQYIPKKPIKRGFKIWCLCDANGGYMQEFQIYTGTNNAYMCKVPIIFIPCASESLHLIFRFHILLYRKINQLR